MLLPQNARFFSICWTIAAIVSSSDRKSAQWLHLQVAVSQPLSIIVSNFQALNCGYYRRIHHQTSPDMESPREEERKTAKKHLAARHGVGNEEDGVHLAGNCHHVVQSICAVNSIT